MNLDETIAPPLLTRLQKAFNDSYNEGGTLSYDLKIQEGRWRIGTPCIWYRATYSNDPTAENDPDYYEWMSIDNACYTLKVTP